MKAVVRRWIAMARRVLDFLQAHPFTDPTALEVQARFEEKLTRAETLVVDQRTHQLGAKAANRRRNQLRKLLETGLLRHLVRVAEVAAKELPALSGMIALPPQDGSNEAFLAAARSMVNLASANHDLLVKHGMPEAMLDDLTHRLTDYEQATEVAVGATRARINAGTEVDSVVREMLELAGLLNGLNRYRFREQEELLRTWTSVSNVLGPFRPAKQEPEPPAGGGVPSAA